MVKKFLSLAAMSAAIILTSTPAFASGSGGGGYSGGGYSGGGISSSPQRAPRDPYASSYARGQSHFKKHIICKKCGYPKGVLDSVTASKIAQRVKAGEFNLNDTQRGDMMVFLQRRYGITV